MNLADLSDAYFNETLLETAESYDGITGKIDLNLVDDRITENHDLWYAVKDNSTDVFKWEAEPKHLDPNH